MTCVITITVMLEHPDISEETVEAVAGHVSRQMRKRYSHVRMAARRAGVSVLDGSVSPLAPEPPRLRQDGALTNEIVLEMLSSGISVAIVVAKLKTSPCAFDTSIETIKRLKSSGVPDSVIVAMVKSAGGRPCPPN